MAHGLGLIGCILLWAPALSLRTDFNGTAESGACGLLSNCCATPKCSKKKYWNSNALVYLAFEKCRVFEPKGPWRTEDGKLVTPEMTSLNKGLFTKLDKADYICRETCDIYKEDAEGQRSYYPEFTGRTVYRAGGVEERPNMNCRFGYVEVNSR